MNTGTLKTKSGILSYGPNLINKQVYALIKEEKLAGSVNTTLVKSLSKDEVIGILLKEVESEA